jgi:two-component system NarL family sensor kinase
MNVTGEDRASALALALLRLSLLAVILASEELIEVRRLGNTGFLVVLAIGVGYAAGLLAAVRMPATLLMRSLVRFAPAVDVALLSALAYASGGSYSDVRKAFFVIPLAAAFSERPRSTATWSLLAVMAFTVQAMLVGDQPVPSHISWVRMTLNQDVYLAWTGAAGTLLAFGLRHRSTQIRSLAASRQRLVTHAIESVEHERVRLAGALHDSPVQNLIAARHDLRRAERTGDADSFARLHEALDETIADLREEIFNLHPHVLDHVGLGAALEQVARRHSPVGYPLITIDVESDLPDREVLFALGRELLANAAKHAHAAQIRVDVHRSAAGVTLEVADDGCGIPDGHVQQALIDGHIGLAESRERVDALGGTLSIETAEGAGTTVRVTLPVAGEQSSVARVTRAVAPRLTTV